MKSGAGEWSAWTLKTATPTDATAYTESVTLVRGHQSYVQFRLDYTLDGNAQSVYAQSAGLDFGLEANITSASVRWVGNRLWVNVAGDYDTRTSGVSFVGRASYPFPPADPTLASNQFTLSDSRFGDIDTGIDVAEPPPGTSAIGYVKVAAVDSSGTEGPVVTIRADRVSVGSPGTATIDTFDVTILRNGTTCSGGSRSATDVDYAVTMGGTDTVTITRYVDGVFDANLLTASGTDTDTLTDEHDWWADGVTEDPSHEVLYQIVVKDSGGTALTDAWSATVTYMGTTDC